MTLPPESTPVPADVGLRPLAVERLGRVGYDDALARQQHLVEERRAGRRGDTLLLLVHDPVITIGVRARGARTNILAAPEALEAAGVQVRETGRGGDVTYHGPGQLVAYPILDLRPDRCDVHAYVRDLEEVVVQAIATFGIRGRRIDGLTGVWVGAPGREAKIAAIGIRISRWITSHGFALNVTTDLRHFGLIVPCGITDRGVTSIAEHLGRPVPMREVEDAVVAAMAAVFGRVAVEAA